MQIVKATELQNNFGKYLQSVIDGNEIIIIKNGKEVARLISKDKTVSYLSDSLLGILKNDILEKISQKKEY
jgi:prevent-host-death family protein